MPERMKYSYCKHCVELIFKRTGQIDWYHFYNGRLECNLVATPQDL